jgi:hypothetical protein
MGCLQGGSGRRLLGQDLQAQVEALVADPGAPAEFARERSGRPAGDQEGHLRRASGQPGRLAHAPLTNEHPWTGNQLLAFLVRAATERAWLRRSMPPPIRGYYGLPSAPARAGGPWMTARPVAACSGSWIS